MLAAIKQIAVTFLTFTNMVVAFKVDQNNVASNDKVAETWDCRFSTVDFHSALLQHGIELDTAGALEVFEDAPVQVLRRRKGDHLNLHVFCQALPRLRLCAAQ